MKIRDEMHVKCVQDIRGRYCILVLHDVYIYICFFITYKILCKTPLTSGLLDAHELHHGVRVVGPPVRVLRGHQLPEPPPDLLLRGVRRQVQHLF